MKQKTFNTDYLTLTMKKQLLWVSSLLDNISHQWWLISFSCTKHKIRKWTLLKLAQCYPLNVDAFSCDQVRSWACACTRTRGASPSHLWKLLIYSLQHLPLLLVQFLLPLLLSLLKLGVRRQKGKRRGRLGEDERVSNFQEWEKLEEKYVGVMVSLQSTWPLTGEEGEQRSKTQIRKNISDWKEGSCVNVRVLRTLNLKKQVESGCVRARVSIYPVD